MSSFTAVTDCLERERAAHVADSRSIQGFERLADLLVSRAQIEDGVNDRRASLFGSTDGVADAPLEGLVAADLPDSGSPFLAAVRACLLEFSANESASVTASEVQHYLRSRTGHDDSIVKTVSRLAGGFSKETIKVSMVDGAGPQSLVLRITVPGRLSGDLAVEFAIARHVWEEGGIPMAEPLWLEGGANCLGRPLAAYRFVRGRCVGDAYGPSPIARPETALHLARVMARLHLLSPSRLSSLPMMRMVTHDELLGAVDRERATLSRLTEDDPSTLYAELLRRLHAWLSDRVPVEEQGPALIHGDIGFHNILVSADQRIAGLFDWELAHIGRAEEDLAYVRPRLGALVDWSTFVDAYCDAGGLPPDPARMQFYAVWQDTRNALFAFQRRRSFLDDTGALADAVTGTLLTPVLLRAALTTAFEVAA